MCNPAALLLTSGGLQAGGAYAQGRTGQQLANYNAGIADQEARDALYRGSEEEARYRREVAQVRGGQNAAFGARNVAKSGTVLDLLSDTALLGERDALTIRKNAGREAGSLRSQANNLRAQGKQLKRNANVAAGSTLLTAGAQAYGWHRQR